MGLISDYASVLAAHDKDRDEKLSRPEVEAMVELIFPKDRPTAINSAESRDWLIADYVSEDTNEDGFLTLAELLKEPLATFNCMDVDKNDSLSRREIEGGMSRCPSKIYYSRIGFMSEPESK